MATHCSSVVLLLHLTFAAAELVGAGVLPHGDFAFDPSLLSDVAARKKAAELQAGSTATGKFLASLKPEVIVLTTPHGLQASWNLGIYQNDQLDGMATVGRDLEESYGHPFPSKLYEVKLNASTDSAMAQDIMDTLTAKRRNVTMLRGWNGVLPLPLHWGEVLALDHVPNDQDAPQPPRRLPPLVTLGLPLSRYNHSSSVAPGFLAMGRELGALFESSHKRVAVLVSTDLAHRHWPNTTFGYSPHAAPFDAAVGRWASTLDADALMVTSAAHVDEIYSCGWLGLVLLHGVLEGAAASASFSSFTSDTNHVTPLNATWRPSLTARPSHPTYYGMMSASFARRTAPPKYALAGPPPTAAFAAAAAVLPARLMGEAAAAVSLPLFKQCDARWGNDQMGVLGPGHRSTICHEGCAMSCVAMALNGKGYVLPGTGGPIDPGSLNAYLVAHKGYHCDAGDCDNLVLSAPDQISGGRMRYVGEWPVAAMDLTALPGLASMEVSYLAHVRSPATGRVSHFVLLLEYHRDLDAFSILDPYYPGPTYARVNVSDVLIYEHLPATSVVPLAYPLMKQCDPAWASDEIHTKTVCAVGCLMSSTAMALRQRGIAIPASGGGGGGAHDATPGTLNAWLRANGGYVAGTNDLDEAAIAKLAPGKVAWTNSSMHTTNDLTWRQVVALLDAGAPVIANVLNGHHFVLVVGVDDAMHGDTLYVNDPGFTRASYSYSKDVVGWRLYAMEQ